MCEFQTEVLKQDIIVTINMLQEKVTGQKYTFEELYKCSIENLESIRDKLVIEYNQTFNTK